MRETLLAGGEDRISVVTVARRILTAISPRGRGGAASATGTAAHAGCPDKYLRNQTNYRAR
ncbi:MAG: hypothetical protein V4850_03410 [Myxococcota bacterium]